MGNEEGGVLYLLHPHDAPTPGANDIDDQLSPPCSGTKKAPKGNSLEGCCALDLILVLS